VPVDVENHSERKFIADEYFSKEGYMLTDYCMRTIRQQKLVLLYDVLPFLMEQEAYNTEILWCPFPYVIDGQDFRQDTMEVIDGFEKMKEFNARYDTEFRMGLAKLWLPQGGAFDKDRAYICRMGAAVDMIGYHYVHSRVLPLGNFTTTDSVKRMGVPVDVENHSERKFVADQYLSEEGYMLTDYGMRTIRQRIRKVFLEEGVVPSDWMKAKDEQLIKAPGYWKGDKFIYYEAPSGAPFNNVLLERANLRVLYGKTHSGKNNLPAITGFKFGPMNVGSATVERQNLTKMAVPRPGVRVKEIVIPAGYKPFPELAMLRYDQERGERLDEPRIVIPRDEKTSTLVRQVTSAPTAERQVIPAPRTVSVYIPSRDGADRQAQEEEIIRKELEKIMAEQEEERRRQPTSLAGAIREMNIANAAPVKNSTVVSRPPQGAQRRLTSRRVSDLSGELEEVEKIPKRGGERGTTSRTTARTRSPTSSEPQSILTDSAEESDNEEMERIREQRHHVKMERERMKMEIDKLEHLEKRHAKERRLRK
jgi:hypothetical protein